MEEVGIEIKNIRYLENHSHEKKVINMSFISEIESGEPQALDEMEEVRWVDYDELKDMKLTPHTIERVEMALKEK
tara:strand:- start:399 stop:623 length:225 start_codon:yes stop_codon:yes gene_type:complete